MLWPFFSPLLPSFQFTVLSLWFSFSLLSWQFLHKLYYPSVSLQYVLSRTLRHSPILSRTLPFIIHSCVQSSPNASSCFSPYFIFFLTFLIPFVLLTPILASRHLTSKWRSTCTIYDTPSSSPPPKRKTKQNKAKQKKNKQKQQESILT